MGARFLRAGGAACLTVGMVLVVSGAAWPAQTGLEVPGDKPGNGVIDGVLAVPGAVLAHPTHEDGATGEEAGATGEEAGATGEEAGATGEEAGAAHEESGDARAERASDAQGASESRDAYITRTCERILGRPPTGGLDKTTDPPAGSSVAAGDTVDVTLTWDPADWSGEELHKTIDCVTVNDAFVLDLSVEERPTENDGSFTTTYTIPVDVVAGDEVCDQGFLSGDTSGGDFGQERSNQVCFTVEAEAGSAGETPAPAPAAPAPAPTEVLPATPAPAPAEVLGEQPAEVLGEQLAAPAPAPRVPAAVAPVAAAPVPEVLGDTLPRTGQETRRGPVLMAGIGLTLGGLGLVGGNRRPRRAPARSGPA